MLLRGAGQKEGGGGKGGGQRLKGMLVSHNYGEENNVMLFSKIITFCYVYGS